MGSPKKASVPKGQRSPELWAKEARTKETAFLMMSSVLERREEEEGFFFFMRRLLTFLMAFSGLLLDRGAPDDLNQAWNLSQEKGARSERAIF